jgi:poly-gamma-glutamate capsule biosynthesis protein CapA/YwtB (metallophosphatase superfamily)
VVQTTMLAVGDIILDEPDPARFFTLAARAVRAAGLAIGHVEVPHTTRGIQQKTAVPAPPADPKHLEALPEAGFGVITLAANHAYDQGEPGVRDTIDTLRGLGIATVGTGMTLAEAREPAIVERQGLRFGVLSYNTVGPVESWAGPAKAGCAYLRVITHYEQDHHSPGAPPTVYTFTPLADVEAMAEDIAALRSRCDVLVVAFHKGIVHTPAVVLDYEKQIARAAIDAGADVVVGHHAHILRGIEIYKGKPIYHGLGNFVCVTKALNYDPSNDSPERRAWALRRRKMFGFEPDPAYPLYPFHPEAKQTIVAKCVVDGRGNVEARYLPAYVNRAYQPEILRRDERGEGVFAYVERISREAGLRAGFAWDGDEVVVRPE